MSGSTDKTRINQQRRSRQNKQSGSQNIFGIIPIIFTISILPLICLLGTYTTNLAMYSWFTTAEENNDVFLYYKMAFFTILSFIIATILVYQIIKKKIDWKKNKIFIPLLIYGIFVILSTIFSEYKWFAIHGASELFETVFVLLGYTLIAFYAANYIKQEKEIDKIVQWLLYSVILLSALGVFQFLGYDFFATKFGQSLITMGATVGDITFGFEKGRVYLTFYNPNYVGVYVALITPIILAMIFVCKTWKERILYIIGTLGLLISLVGSVSFAGTIALVVSIIALIVFLRKKLMKQYKIVGLSFILVAIILAIVFMVGNNALVNRIKNFKAFEKKSYNIEAIQINEDKVTVRYRGHEVSIHFEAVDGSINLRLHDENGESINSRYDAEQNKFIIENEELKDITIEPFIYNDLLSFGVNIDGSEWIFTNQTGDGHYYYINSFGKLDQIIQPESYGFDGYEYIISNRGYIWSRTLPMLKDNILIGAGPDSYILTYPHQDYVGLYNAGMQGSILSKPHSLYLQMATQTGMISMLAFVVFYILYFISSIMLYWKSQLSKREEMIGVAILCGTLGYMITGLTNDSNLATAPVFWALIGVGIAVNRRVKLNATR